MSQSILQSAHWTRGEVIFNIKYSFYARQMGIVQYILNDWSSHVYVWYVCCDWSYYIFMGRTRAHINTKNVLTIILLALILSKNRMKNDQKKINNTKILKKNFSRCRKILNAWTTAECVYYTGTLVCMIHFHSILFRCFLNRLWILIFNRYGLFILYYTLGYPLYK